MKHCFFLAVTKRAMHVAMVGLVLAALPFCGMAAPVITNQPASPTIFYGDSVTFGVGATGTGPLTYQWFRNGAIIGGATTNAYVLATTSSADQGAGFFVVVTDSSGSVTSAVATLTVDLGVIGTAQTNQILTINEIWKYNQTNNPGASWALTGYNDTVAGWLTGGGVFDGFVSGTRTTVAGETVGTHLALQQSGTNRSTYYFRTHFMFSPWPSAQSAAGVLQAEAIIDDGAVIYLNGNEGYRVGVTNTAYGVFASRVIATAAKEFFELPVTNLVGGDNLLAVEVQQCNPTSSDISFGLKLTAITYPRLRDTTVPTLAGLYPPPGTISSLTQLEVHFSEAVKGIEAADFLVNGIPATNVTVYAPDVYVFSFPQPPSGAVTVAWQPAHAITDISANANPFGGGSYDYTLDTSTIGSTVRISEFMASNADTITDEDGDYSDWIELYNAGNVAVDIGLWYLTDNAAKPTKWRFPAGVVVPANSYLLVWASSNNRTNPAAPLHTNFKLDKGAGNYLGLIFSNGVDVISAFASYPQQFDDVSYGRDRLNPTTVGYYTNATPGNANSTTGGNFASEVVFSKVSGTFQQPFALALTTDSSNAVIRYFLVTNSASAALTNVPNSSSPLYTEPLTVSNSVQVRARAFPAQSNYFPSPFRTETYLRISAGAAAFASASTPIVLFCNFNGGTPTAATEQSAVMMVFDTTYGYACMTNPPDLVERIGINLRGKSTEGYNKKSFAVEVRDEFNDDRKVEVLGLPEESDWVFYGVNGFDRPLIHNPFMYELGRQVRGYTPRTRMVEVFTSFNSAVVNYTTPLVGNYNGFYVLEEKVKVSSSRLGIPKLSSSETNQPAISGGYLLKIDQADADEHTFVAANKTMIFVEPKMDDIAAAGRIAQSNYIRGYFNSFYSALTGVNWTNPATGYAAWIDTDSWIDCHILNVFAMNVDAFQLSCYFFKDRNKRIEMGPIWDFDRALGGERSEGGAAHEWRAWNPRSWITSNPFPYSTNTGYGSDFFNSASPWYGKILKDPDFWQKWIDRYQDLRLGVFSTNYLFGIMDQFADQSREAQARDMVRWAGDFYSDSTPRSGLVAVPAGWPDTSYTHIFPGTYQGEIDFMKQWATDRLTFMDTNFLAKPVFSNVGGSISPDFSLTITSPAAEPGTTIYYTLNGSDPRLPGGGLSPAALAGVAPIMLTLTNNTRVFARNWNAAHHNLTGTRNPPISSYWSGATAATFVVATPQLAITEIMYHPADALSGTNDADDFEFIELKNVGGEPLNLIGIRFTNGIDFTFSATNAVTNLDVGQYIVIVKNTAAFLSRYPTVTNLAGQYAGSLDNSGEHLRLEGHLKEPILDFSYNDLWYPTTDGAGFSLVIRNENASFTTWPDAASWRASSFVNGSPGQADPAPATIPPVLVNEALTHTDLPELDSVELYNPTANPVAIGGWFLTDNHNQPMKYRIPNNTIIPSGGYLTFDENQFSSGASNSFRFSSLGEEIYLFSGDGTNLTGYRHGFEFGAQFNGVSFGRYVTSDGGEHFVSPKANTLGAANPGPKVGLVVINEIMYAPPSFGLNPDTLDEYIELHNNSNQTVPLYHPLYPASTWQLQGGVQFTFPLGVTMSPQSYLLVVNFDPVHDPVALDWFRARYQLNTNTVIFGPYQGNLANEGENVSLYQPDKPEIAPSPNAGFVPYILVEAVNYNPQSPWPTDVLGSGNSLQRIASVAFADDPINWAATSPSPGRINSASQTVDTDGDGLSDEWELVNGLDPQNSSGANGGLGDPDGDGMNNYQEFIAGTDPHNSADLLRFDSVSVSSESCVLQFNVRSNHVYTVEAVDELEASSVWTSVTNFVPDADGPCIVSEPLSSTAQFYRLKVTNLP